MSYKFSQKTDILTYTYLYKKVAMLGLTIKDTKDKIVFTIEKNNFTEEVYLQMMEVARLEYLVKKAAFDEAIVDFGKQLKADLWKKNKKEFLKGIKDDNR